MDFTPYIYDDLRVYEWVAEHSKTIFIVATLVIIVAVFDYFITFARPIGIPDSLWNAKKERAKVLTSVFDKYVNPKQVCFYEDYEVENGEEVCKYFVKYRVRVNFFFEDEYLDELSSDDVLDAEIIKAIQEGLVQGYDDFR